MELNITLQLINFAKSLLFGFAFFALFDMFRVLRSIFNFSTLVVFFQDLAYFMVTSLSMLIFFFAVNNGEIRIYILFGMFLGWIIGFFTYGKMTRSVVEKCQK